jgi:lysophospholipase L1-like esterase
VKALVIGIATAVGLGIALLSSSSKAKSKMPLKVLAVGDSLTAGAYPTLFEHYLAPGSTVSVQAVEGGGAERVYHNAYNALASGNYDVVVVLAGVNDLASGRSVSTAKEWLQRIYDEAIAAGARVVAVELLPWASHPVGAKKVAETEALNLWIRQLDGILGTRVVSTTSMGDGLGRSLYAGSDGLHLTRAGNEKLAQLVAAAVEK